MQLKPEVTLTLNHDDLALTRRALGALPFDAVAPLLAKLDQQMRAPENQIEPEADNGDDKGNA